jgi:hypothetical protein
MPIERTLGAITMRAIGLLAILLAVVPASSVKNPIAPNQFVINTAEPYVYIKFDHIGKRQPVNEGDGSEGLWLRLVNNCNVPIKILTNGLGTNDPGVSIPYSVIPRSGMMDGLSVEKLKTMPTGYAADVGTPVTLAPGENLLFSVPRNRVTPLWHIQIRFDFALPGEQAEYNPYSLVDFTWDLLPDRSRTAQRH